MKPTPAPAICVVTGANSGIGRATALHLASEGYTVYGTVRSRDKAGKLLAAAESLGVEIRLVELDVADDDSVRRGFDTVFAETDGVVDVLVNNAGVGGNSVAEECTSAMYLDVMNINLCGPARCWRQVLPGMRERGRGSIVNISSVVGRLAALAQSPYVASKWALEGASEELAQEVAPFGVRVVIIEPGVTRSSIFGKNIDAPNQTGAYDLHYRRMFQMYAVGLSQATDPREVGRVIHGAITAAQPTLRHTVSWGAAELVAGRTAMTDEQWVQMSLPADDEEYYSLFMERFGIDLRLPG